MNILRIGMCFIIKLYLGRFLVFFNLIKSIMEINYYKEYLNVCIVKYKLF